MAFANEKTRLGVDEDDIDENGMLLNHQETEPLGHFPHFGEEINSLDVRNPSWLLRQPPKISSSTLKELVGNSSLAYTAYPAVFTENLQG